MKPIETKTNEDLCMLETDNFQGFVDGWSMLLGVKEVYLHSGPPERYSIAIPKEEFDKLVAWYTADQPTK
jgi:hypothetical protein